MGQGALLREESPCPALSFQHRSELADTFPFPFAFRFGLEIVPKTLFDNRPTFEYIYEVPRFDL